MKKNNSRIILSILIIMVFTAVILVSVYAHPVPYPPSPTCSPLKTPTPGPIPSNWKDTGAGGTSGTFTSSGGLDSHNGRTAAGNDDQDPSVRIYNGEGWVEHPVYFQPTALEWSSVEEHVLYASDNINNMVLFTPDPGLDIASWLPIGDQGSGLGEFINPNGIFSHQSGDVYVVDTGDCVARYSKYCRKFFKCSDYQSDRLSDFLITLAKQENIQDWLLLPSNDHAVINISKNKDELEKYFKLITPEIDIINKICNKENLLKIALDVGVPIPQSEFHENLSVDTWNLSFPVITKGKNGLSFYKKMGTKALVSSSRQELVENLELIRKQSLLKDSFTQSIIFNTEKNNTLQLHFKGLESAR